jgi:hypothetical protein
MPALLSVSAAPGGCNGSGGIANANATGGRTPYTYSWSNGETTSTATALGNTTYTVTVTDHCGTTGTASVHIMCLFLERPTNDSMKGNNPLGTDNMVEVKDISIYPNPNNGEFTISGLDNGMMIEMYDYTGRLINKEIVNNETMQFNLSNQANGIYLVRIISPDGNLVTQKKIVKQR